MPYEGTDGEVGPNMTLSQLKAAVMFRVSAHGAATTLQSQVRVLKALSRQLALDELRGVFELGLWIVNPPTGRLLSGSTMQCVGEYLGLLEMALDLVDFEYQQGFRPEPGTNNGPNLSWYKDFNRRALSVAYRGGLQRDGRV